jgi:hypothetical protein
VDTGQKAGELYDQINKDLDFQKLLIDNIDDITTVLFVDVGNENNLSRFAKEYFKLFKKVYTVEGLKTLYRTGAIPERNKFFFYGFDHDCDFTLSVGHSGDKLIIKEQPRRFDPHLGKTGHCMDDGSPLESTFLAQDILAVSVADKGASLFGEKDRVVMMPALAYYLLIKASNEEEAEKIINGLVSVVGVISPYDEFYFLSQALKLATKGLRASRLVTLKALTKTQPIEVPLSQLGKKLKSEAPADINNYVKFVEELQGAGSFVNQIDNTVSRLTSKAKFALNNTGEYKVVAGHHPMAKKAFEGDLVYDYQKAFSVATSELDNVSGITNIHPKITGQQNKLYSAWKQANPNAKLTIDAMADIEIQAMKNVGIPEDVATGWVVKSLQDLKARGVTEIKNIPWNGVN